MSPNGRAKWMEKTIPLTLLPGRTKRTYLRKAQAKILAFANQLIPYKSQAQTRLAFHHLVYKRYKYLGIHSQVQEAVQRRVYAAKKVKQFAHIPLEFNFPRSGGLTWTKRGNPILKISPLKQRIALPIRQDGGWQRVQEYINNGWEAHSCKVFKDKRHKRWVAHLIIRKKCPPPQEVEGTIGVDIGRKIGAAITLNHPAFPLIEQYLGKDLVWKQHQFDKRRRTLQSYADQGSVRARRALTRLKQKETNYNKTRCAQIAHEILDLAVLTRSAIIIENIETLRKQWTKQASPRKGKKTRRQLNKWPFRIFLSFLTSLAHQYQIPIRAVNPQYTSQICAKCGHTAKQSRVTRDLYQCTTCGFTVNGDRNASRNIAVRGLYTVGLPLSTSWSSYLPVPRERHHSLVPDSVVEVRSTTSSGSMTGSVPVD